MFVSISAEAGELGRFTGAEGRALFPVPERTAEET